MKTKEMTNDDAERTGKGWFHSQRRREMTLMGIVIVVILLVAWRYVF